MATLTNPVEDQNIVNRFADYVPPAANTGISWGSNSFPFSHGSWPGYFGGSTGGRSLGISGASLKNSGELLPAVDSKQLSKTKHLIIAQFVV